MDYVIIHPERGVSFIELKSEQILIQKNQRRD